MRKKPVEKEKRNMLKRRILLRYHVKAVLINTIAEEHVSSED